MSIICSSIWLFGGFYERQKNLASWMRCSDWVRSSAECRSLKVSSARLLCSMANYPILNLRTLLLAESPPLFAPMTSRPISASATPPSKRARVFSKTRRTILTLTIHQHFPSEILYRIKRIIFAQQFAFRYPSDVINFSGLNS